MLHMFALRCPDLRHCTTCSAIHAVCARPSQCSASNAYNVQTRSNAWCSVATLSTCANLQMPRALSDTCIWLAPCSNTGAIENPHLCYVKLHDFHAGMVEGSQLPASRVCEPQDCCILLTFPLFCLSHEASDTGCAFPQARLARQLKEAMAERQLAKSENKALHTQLDRLQKQVGVRRNTLLRVLHGQLVTP